MSTHQTHMRGTRKRSCNILLSLLFVVLLPCLLAACGSSTPTPPGTTISPQAQPGLAYHMATGKFQEFALPQNNNGLMRPVVDTQGRIWFGEMNRNYLGSFDPRTGKFWQQTPPHGKWGVMGMVTAPDDTLWFTEQYANYIGHYFPQSGQYKIYPLPTMSITNPGDAHKNLILPSAPNDIALDARGTLWFTEINANTIGSLNPRTGSIHQYALSSNKKARALDPYGITIDQQGGIWFTEASTAHLGKLNPLTGQISYFTPPGVTSTLMELTNDTQGQIWATTFTNGQLIRFNPRRNSFTVYTLPALTGAPGALNDVTSDAQGNIWVVVTAENMLARLDNKGQHFTFYPLPSPNSLTIGLIARGQHEIWFTESGSSKLGELLL